MLKIGHDGRIHPGERKRTSFSLLDKLWILISKMILGVQRSTNLGRPSALYILTMYFARWRSAGTPSGNNRFLKKKTWIKPYPAEVVSTKIFYYSVVSECDVKVGQSTSRPNQAKWTRRISKVLERIIY